MRAKTLNLAASVYTQISIPGHNVTVRLSFTEGKGFEAAEAYMHVEKRIPEGSIKKNLNDLMEVIDEWYNAEFEGHTIPSMWDDIDPDTYIIARGYAKLNNNWRYTYEMDLVKQELAKMKTKRELSTR